MIISIKKIITIVCCAMLINLSAFAEGPVKLKKGDPAPADGYFFTLSQEQQVRLDLIRLQNLELELELKDNLILEYKQQIDFHIQVEEKYKDSWQSAEDDLLSAIKANKRNKLLYLLLGIGLTIGAGVALGAAN